jgi:hypothetical protein
MLDDPLTDRIAASQRAGNLALETQARDLHGRFSLV